VLELRQSGAIDASAPAPDWRTLPRIKEGSMPNAFCHIELSTDDVSKSKKFYKGLFAWKLDAMPGNYLMIDVGKGTGGGITAKQMPQQPTAWMPYVEVDDVKKTVAKARKLGADVKVDYMEIPGGMGAFGVFVDPTGATLGVWEAAKKKPAAKAKKSAKKKAKK
jgi:predicted enzyme related to lactoylglutathione lyase